MIDPDGPPVEARLSPDGRGITVITRGWDGTLDAYPISPMQAGRA